MVRGVSQEAEAVEISLEGLPVWPGVAPFSEERAEVDDEAVRAGVADYDVMEGVPFGVAILRDRGAGWLPRRGRVQPPIRWQSGNVIAPSVSVV